MALHHLFSFYSIMDNVPETGAVETLPGEVQEPARDMAQNGATPSVANPDRPLTMREEIVGLGFNPSGDPTVYHVKRLFAEVIYTVRESDAVAGGFKGELKRQAIGLALQAQMMAVKAITWKDPS